MMPNEAMAAEAQRGLDWRAEYGRGGTEIGVARARDIINRRNLSPDTVRRMRSYFARHEVDKQGRGWSPGTDGYPSAGRIAWALWGGDAGRTWAERVAQEEDRMDITGDEVRDALATHPTTEHVWVRLEERAVSEVDGSPHLSGLASVFDVRARVKLPDGRVVAEEVARSAFSNTLERSDIFLLWQHDWATPLARTGAGNLQLRLTDRGLSFDAQLPDTQAGRDAAELVRTGVVSQMSFGFTLPAGGDRVTVQPDGTILRTLTDVRLHEVSLVSRAAYGAATNAALRSDAFGLLCRSLSLDEDEILSAVSGIEESRATVPIVTTTCPGVGTTSESVERAGTTAAGIPASTLLAQLALQQHAERAGIRK